MAKKKAAKKSPPKSKELVVTRKVPKTKAEAEAMAVDAPKRQRVLGFGRNVRTVDSIIPELDGVVGSEQQMQIWEAMVHGYSHLMVNARAGTGKTFSMVHGLRLLEKLGRMPRYVNFAAFTRAVGNELKGIVPQGVRAGTIHSFGLSACNYKHKQEYNEDIKIDEDKMEKLLREEMGSGLSRQDKITFNAVLKLCSLAKNCLVGQVHDEDDHWYYDVAWELLDELCLTYDVELQDRELTFQLVEKIMGEGLELDGVIDQDDMIWFPVVKGYRLFQADLLLVDEDQDLNACQHEFILKSGRRIVVVGDEFQSIYGFRGADVYSVPHLREMLRSTQRGLSEYGLTVTRRCPKKHVEYVLLNGKVQDFQAHPEAIEGELETLTDKVMQKNVRHGEMVICRTNAPLVSLAFWLTRNTKQSVRIQGRDIAGQLVRLVDHLVEGSNDIEHFTKALRAYTEAKLNELRRAKDSRRERAISVITERAVMLHEFARNSATVKDMKAEIEKLFVDAKNTDRETFILLGCVHQLKGLEADTVWVYGPEDMPHRMARTPEEIQQEWNCWYVAHTRSRNRMYLVALPGTNREAYGSEK